jgi:pyruvate dehydrogenase (quinone)/pyruvate oxidase
MNGIYDAKVDQAPLIAITGMTYHDVIGTEYLQDINQDYLFNDACWFNQRVMGHAHVPNVVDHAVRSAIAHRGPSHISIPIDIQAGQAVSDDRSIKNIAGHTSVSSQRQHRAPPDDELQRAASLLKGKTRPVIFAGAGARGCRVELEQTAETLGAPIVKALLGKDCVPDDSPYTTGGYALVGTRPSQDALKSCDAILIVGSSSPYIEYLPEPGSAVGVQIDDRPDRIGLRFPVEVGLAGDAQATLRGLLPLLERNEDRSFLEQAQAGMRDWNALEEERATRDDVPMKPQTVGWHLSELLDDDAIVCGDSGTVTTWGARLRLRRNQQFSFSGTMCSMAAGLPYAIGAQAAYPDRQVVAFTGDGSMTMLMGDLATLAQEKLPVKVVVIKNDVLGLIKWEQMAFLGNPQYGVELSPVDFAKVADACGVRGVRIEDPKRCREELASALAEDGPALIEAVVDPHEMPMTPTINRQHAQQLAQGLARGEPNRERIALTMSRTLAQEVSYSTSPAGVLARAKDRIAEAVGADSDSDSDSGDGPER